MSSELFEFPWLVCQSGYRAETGRLTASVVLGGAGVEPEEQRLLVENQESGRVGLRPYDPLLTEPALFRTFAATEPTEAGILTFANQYGQLGIGRMGESGGRRLGHAEPIKDWICAITDLRRTLALWDWYREHNIEELARYFRRQRDDAGGESILYDSHPDEPDHLDRVSMLIASPEVHAELQPLIRPDDVCTPARAYLHRFVSRQLAGRVSPRLLFDAHTMETVLRSQPHNLLSCLWLQFAETMSGGKRQQQCPACKRFFELGGSKGKRKDKQFCSAACRNRAYRVRLEEQKQQRARSRTSKRSTKRKGK